MQALLIPVEGPLQTIELDGTLDQLQSIVGGYIEAVPLHNVLESGRRATAYIHEEGKFMPRSHVGPDGNVVRFGPNMRATDFMVPGVGLFPGDYIAGPFLLCGFDVNTGDHGALPAEVIERARLIESEAA